ncbi:MAG: putative manganese transporter [Rhodococcus sp. (in: high G+C Gram-positive bacteria)]
MFDWTETVGDPLADSFLGVGVLVALMLISIGWARARWGSRWDRWLTRFPQAGPFVAALLSVPPGCSGVIVTVTLYGERRVTYGTVVAALLATMGDSAWILIAFDPVLALELKALFMFVGAVGGYLVDLARIEPRAHALTGLVGSADRTVVSALRADSRPSRSMVKTDPTETVSTLSVGPQAPPVSGSGSSAWERMEPCCFAPVETTASTSAARSAGYVFAFWSMIAVGALLAVPTMFFGIEEDAFSGLAGSHTFVGVGVVGFAVAAVVAVRGRFHRRHCHCVDITSRQVILRHTAFKAATMIVIVGVVSTLLTVVTALTGLDPESLPFYGLMGVVLAAALGLLPSCGLEVAMASLFVVGGMPLAALLAYLVSHDGAGLIPLFAVHKRSAVLSTVLTTVPAVAIGLAALAFA